MFARAWPSIALPSATVASTSATATSSFTAPAGERLRHRELVEVARVVVVDRHPREVPQVADGGPRLDDALAEGLGLREDRGGEVGQQAAFGHRPPGDGPQLLTSGRRVGVTATS